MVLNIRLFILYHLLTAGSVCVLTQGASTGTIGRKLRILEGEGYVVKVISYFVIDLFPPDVS